MKSTSIGSLALIAASSFAGTIIGNGARLLVQARLQREQVTAAGEEEPEDGEIVITGVISNAVAATAIGALVPDRGALYGFLAAVALSAATGDLADRWIQEQVGGLVSNGDVMVDDHGEDSWG